MTLRGDAPSSNLPAYGHVLENLLEGSSTIAVRGDEAEEAWRVVTPVLDAWADGTVPLLEYPAGSSGPESHIDPCTVLATAWSRQTDYVPPSTPDPHRADPPRSGVADAQRHPRHNTTVPHSHVAQPRRG